VILPNSVWTKTAETQAGKYTAYSQVMTIKGSNKNLKKLMTK